MKHAKWTINTDTHDFARETHRALQVADLVVLRLTDPTDASARVYVSRALLARCEALEIPIPRPEDPLNLSYEWLEITENESPERILDRIREKERERKQIQFEVWGYEE